MEKPKAHTALLATIFASIIGCSKEQEPITPAGGGGGGGGGGGETATTSSSPPTEIAYTSTSDLPQKDEAISHAITEDHVPEGSFPMKRGTEVIKRLRDGTTIETLEDTNGDFNIYTVNGDQKIKFANPTEDQQARILATADFEQLEQLAITFIEEDQQVVIEQRKNTYRHAVRMLMTARKDMEDDLRILMEGPIDDCPKYRYRRGMSVSPVIGTMWNTECIWQERSITCPDKENGLPPGQWISQVDDGKFKIAHDGEITNHLAPTPQQWIEKQPECPPHPEPEPQDTPPLDTYQGPSPL